MEAEAHASFDAHAAPHDEAPEVPRTETGLRVLYTSVFTLVLHVVAAIASLLVLVQLALALVTRQPPHERLTRFGSGLTRYTAQVMEYLTYNRSAPPFPFEDLPDEGPRA